MLIGLSDFSSERLSEFAQGYLNKFMVTQRAESGVCSDIGNEKARYTSVNCDVSQMAAS